MESNSDREIYTPPGGPPRVMPPSREIYVLMGEAQIFNMLEHFYRELQDSALRGLFPADMVAASHKSAMFFVGLFGGPQLYQQRYGSPMLRARHLPFVITEGSRREWLACFDRVLDVAVENYGFPPQHLDGFRTFLHEFSRWMVNTAS